MTFLNADRVAAVQAALDADHSTIDAPEPGASIRAIIDRVARRRGVLTREILSEACHRALVDVRDEAVYQAVVETLYSLPRIGRAFGRDHTCIIQAVRRHCRRHDLPLPRKMTWGVKKLPKRITEQAEAVA